MPSIAEQLRAYETSVGKRTGRLAITIDQGTVSRLGCTAKIMKWYLKGLCVFLVVAAIIILAMGSYMSNNNGASAALGSGFTNAIYVCGAFLLIMGIFGAIGSVRESRLFVWIFSVLMIIMTLILLILSAVLLSYAGQEQQVLGRFWQAMATSDRTYVQNSYQCCGANYNPLTQNVRGTKSYPIFSFWDQCANTIGCSQNGTAYTYGNPPVVYTYFAAIPVNPTLFDGGQLHVYPCPQWEGVPGVTYLTVGQLNPIPGCIPALINNYQSATTGFGVAGIFMGIFCLSGVFSSCCLLSGIQASEEQQKAVNKKGGGRA